MTHNEDRIADLRRRLSGAEKAATERHTGHAEAIGRSFDRLRTGLESAHAGSHVDDHGWADYAAGLDRGLDELDRELAHATDPTAVEGTLLVHASKLELAGWRLRFSLPSPATSDPATSDPAGVRRRLTAAETEVDRYASGGSSPAEVRRTIDDLRDVRADN